MYILNMVIILNVLYNNVVTAVRYICTYYVSTAHTSLVVCNTTMYLGLNVMVV
jgi:hypothetical protein